METPGDKPWDEMTGPERVEWFRRRGTRVTPEELRAYLEGAASNHEALAAVEDALARLKAQNGVAAPAPDGAPNTPPN